MKKMTITIGIPAYNEEANIDHLLRALITDSSKQVKLVEIVVISDGSTDATVARARSIKDGRIKVVDRKVRKGVNETQNEILRLACGDILVLLNADVMPVYSDFLDRITKSIRTDRNVGMVGADTVPLPPRNIFERVIANSHYMKQYMYRRIRGGNNVYLCHGRGRAFARPFYAKLRWPNNCPEDAYSYFVCITKHYKFVYAKNAGVYFRSPSTLAEHVLQSTRFVSGISHIIELFGARLVHKEYGIAKFILIKTIFRYLYRNPFSMPAYIVLTLYIRIAYNYGKRNLSRYMISPSSKRVVLYKGQKLSRI